MRFLRYCAAALAASVVALSAGGPASAHNSLVEATPRKGAVLAKPPAGVKLRFLQTVDGRSTSIDVVGAGEQRVVTEKPETDGKVASVAFAEPLAAGEYTVTYRVVSHDGHPVQGSYKFTVRGPAIAKPSATAAPAATDESTAEPAAEATVAPSRDVVPAALVEDEGTPWWPIAAVVAGVALVATGGVIVARRRR